MVFLIVFVVIPLFVIIGFHLSHCRRLARIDEKLDLILNDRWRREKSDARTAE